MAISRPRQAFNFFRQRGLSDAQSAGLVGNLMQESGPDLDSSASGDDGSAFGMAQWRLDRRDNLEQKAEERGVDPSNFNLQLEHTWDELIGPERQAFDQLIRAETPEEAATVAQDAFFRPNPDLAHTDRRVNFATELLSSGENRGQNQARGPMGDRTFAPASEEQNFALPNGQNPRDVQIAGEQSMANGNQRQQQLMGLLAGGNNNQQQEEPSTVEGLLGSPMFTGGLGLLAAAPAVRRGDMNAFEALSGAANLGTGMAQQMQDIRSQRQSLQSRNRINQALQNNPEALGLTSQQAAAIQALPAERQQQVLANVASQGQRPTSEMRNLRAAGIDPSSEEGRQILLNDMRGGQDQRLQQLELIQTEQEILDSRREREEERKTAAREETDAQNAASRLRRNIIEMQDINERLADTSARTGSGYQDMAATALGAGGATGLAENFGFEKGEASQIASDFERLNQLATSVVVNDLETMRGSGRVTNTILETMLATKPGTGVQPETNSRRLADMLEGTHQIFGQLGMEGMDEFIEQDQERISSWRDVGVDQNGQAQGGQQPQSGTSTQPRQGGQQPQQSQQGQQSQQDDRPASELSDDELMQGLQGLF